MLEAPREAVHNETFNVGADEENYRIRELADIVAEVVPGCEIEYAPGGGPDKRCYRVNCDKIRRVLPGLPSAVDRPQGRAGTLRRLSRRRTDGCETSGTAAISASTRFSA